MPNKFRRIIASLLCLSMLLVAAPTAYANDELDELNDKYEQLEKEQKALQGKIDQAKNDKEKQLAIKEKTSQDITILKSQIAVLREKITVLEADIDARETEIAGLEDDIADSYELFKQRMRAMYMSDTSTTLGLVLGADSFGDFLVRGETVKRVAEHDRELIAELTAAKENIEEIKAGLDADKVELEGAKQSVEAKNGELDQKLNTTVAKIQDLDSMEKEFLANKEALQKQMKEVQSELDAIYASLEELDEEFVGGTFTLPVPGFSKITSYYGWRFNNTDFHTGIDFSGTNVFGKKVVAANSGMVTYTNETYVSGRGYGKYIIVDHGGGYSTLYGHLSEITVSEGDRVGKGKQIGKVGSTGWSTGPHLHWEIRINGKHTNPINYLRG